MNLFRDTGAERGGSLTAALLQKNDCPEEPSLVCHKLQAGVRGLALSGREVGQGMVWPTRLDNRQVCPALRYTYGSSLLL